MAEPAGTDWWLVDASAMGQKGLHWRTHLGKDDKFITRPGDGDANGFAVNGERFRGVEDLRGWVRNVRTNLWLPVRDIPATGATPLSDELLARGITPTGRGRVARGTDNATIPYLHKPESCACGGRWCTPPPAPRSEEPRRRKPVEPTYKPPPPPVRTPRAEPRSWTWWQYGVAAFLALLALLVLSGWFEVPPGLRRESWWLAERHPKFGARPNRAPTLESSLRPWFQG